LGALLLVVVVVLLEVVEVVLVVGFTLIVVEVDVEGLTDDDELEHGTIDVTVIVTVLTPLDVDGELVVDRVDVDVEVERIDVDDVDVDGAPLLIPL